MIISTKHVQKQLLVVQLVISNCPWTGFREEFQTHLSTCTFEQLRSQSEQSNDENVEKVAKPINGK